MEIKKKKINACIPSRKPRVEFVKDLVSFLLSV